jgi:hypothetical protein
MARQAGCGRLRLFHLAKQSLLKRRVTDAAFHQRSEAEEFDRWVKAKPMLSA